MSKISSIQILTPLQEGMLFHALKGEDNTAYFEQYSFTVSEHIDKDCFLQALELVIERHDVLRARYIADKGARPVQVILAGQTPDLQIFEYGDIDDILISDRKRSFDLATDNLFRAILLYTQQGTRVVLSYHHIILDGWSFAIVLKELFLVYSAIKNKQRLVLPKSSSFVHFLKWLEDSDETSCAVFWKNHLATETDFEIAGFYSGSAVVNAGMPQVSLSMAIDEMLTARLVEMARSLKLSINTVVYSIWGALLARYNQKQTVVSGLTVSGRNAPIDWIVDMVGLCVNTVPFRFNVDDTLSVEEYLKNVSSDFTESIPYQHYSLADIQKSANSSGSLFDHILVIEDYPYEDMAGSAAMKGIDLSGLDVFEETHYPLSVHVSVGPEMRWRLSFDPSRYGSELMQQVLQHILLVAEKIIDGVVFGRRLASVSIIEDKYKDDVLLINAEAVGYYPEHKTLLSQYYERLVESAHTQLLHDVDNVLSPEDVERYSNNLQSLLHDAGVRKGDKLGICSDRSVWLMVAIIACYKQGTVYVPIDATQPAERLSFLLEDSGVKVLIGTVGKLPHVDSVTLIGLDRQLLEEPRPAIPTAELSPSDTAYIIYTSGSTGKPKGVMVSHTSAVNRVYWMQQDYPLAGGDCIMQKTPITFDVSVWELFHWLFSGCNTFFLANGKEKEPDEIITVIKRQNITVMHFVPSMLSVFIDYVRDNTSEVSSLKYLFASGEELSFSTVVDFNTNMYETNATKLINLYGPTEATVDCTGFVCSPLPVGYNYIPIGKPLLNYGAYVLNEKMQVLPPWVAGELYISGVGIAQGYINRAQLTSERFLNNPYSDGRIYKTGDAVLRTAKGEIVYLGRLDNQVKLNGQRIECGEIEAAMMRVQGIDEAAVILHKKNDLSVLVGFYSGLKGIKDDISAILVSKLPAAMVPAYLVHVDDMPKLGSGKIDRNSLKRMAAEGIFNTALHSDHLQNDAVQLQLLELWKRVLGKPVDVSKDFFANGGHSLTAIRLIASIRKKFNVSVSLPALFLNATISKLATHIRSLNQDVYQTISTAPEKDLYDLLPAQQSLYALQQMPGIGCAYQVPAIMMLQQHVTSLHIQAAIGQLISRHASLRTCFVEVDGSIYQKVQLADWAIAEFSKLVGFIEIAAGQDMVADWQKVREEIDISRAPLLRVYFITQDAGFNYVVLDIHHLVTDEHSNNIFVSDLLAILEGTELAKLKYSHIDFAYWYNEKYLKEAQYKLDKEWWGKYLHEHPATLDLSLKTRPPQLSFGGAMIDKQLDGDISRFIIKLSNELSVTSFSVILAAFTAIISRCSLQDDFLLGIPFSLQQAGDMVSATGMFVNTLPFRARVGHSMSFQEHIQQTGGDLVELMQRSSYPLLHLAQDVNAARSADTHLLFSVLFNYVSLAGKPDLSHVDQLIPAESKFDLSVETKEFQGDFIISFTYCTDLFERHFVDALFIHFCEFLKNAQSDFSMLIGDIDIVTAEEKQELIAMGAGRKVENPYTSLQAILKNAYTNYTTNTAIKTADGDISYAALKLKIDAIAGEILKKVSVKKDDVIAVYMHRSETAIAAIHAIVLLGAAYLPIDSALPEERIRFMLQDSAAVLVLSDRHFPYTIDVDAVIVNDFATGNVIDYEDRDGDYLAYIIYTSGSTGQPKGVMVETGSVANRLCWLQRDYPSAPDDTWVWKTSMSLDVSVGEIFGWTLSGSSLAILNNADEKDPVIICQAISRYAVTRVHFVPSMLQAFLEYVATFQQKPLLESLRLVLSSGESVTPALINDYKNTGLVATFLVLYGPTETTVEVTSIVADPHSESVSIGYPVDNVNIYIVHPVTGTIQPLNTPGELWVEGVQVARGYKDRPAVQYKHFIPSPFSQGERIYKTGDIALFTADGQILFRGRQDSQVKVNGYRIDLGEIVHAVEQHPGVSKCICIVVEQAGVKKIHAYYKLSTQVALEELREYIRLKLPPYCMPELFQAAEFPVNNSEKVDVKELKVLNTVSLPEIESVTDEVEVALIGIFEDVLARNGLSVDSDFFSYGGHSILALKLINRIQKQLRVKLSLKDIFQYQSPRSLARYIRKADKNDIAIIPYLGEKDVYDVAPAQRRLWFLQSKDLLSVAYNMTYTFKVAEPLAFDALKETLALLVTMHDQLRASFSMQNEQLVTVLHNTPDTADYLSVVDAGADENKARELINTFSNTPFSLDRFPLFRVMVVNIDGGFYLSLSIHHAITDGWAMTLLLNQLQHIYRLKQKGEYVEGKENRSALRYVDIASWMIERLASQKDTVRKYWGSKIAGDIQPAVLPHSGHGTNVARQGATSHFVLDKELSEAIKKTALSWKCSEYQLMLFGFGMLIVKLSGQSYFVFGSSVAGRSHPATEHIFGFFVNMLPVIMKLEMDAKVKDSVADFAAALLDDMNYEALPFDELNSVVREETGVSLADHIRMRFVYNNFSNSSLEHLGSVEEVNTDMSGTKFDMSFTVQPNNDDFTLNVEYATAHYDKPTIAFYVQQWQSVMKDICNDREQTIADLLRKKIDAAQTTKTQSYQLLKSLKSISKS
jgi:amino acid adenylation domain